MPSHRRTPSMRGLAQGIDRCGSRNLRRWRKLGRYQGATQSPFGDTNHRHRCCSLIGSRAHLATNPTRPELSAVSFAKILIEERIALNQLYSASALQGHRRCRAELFLSPNGDYAEAQASLASPPGFRGTFRSGKTDGPRPVPAAIQEGACWIKGGEIMAAVVRALRHFPITTRLCNRGSPPPARDPKAWVTSRYGAI